MAKLRLIQTQKGNTLRTYWLERSSKGQTTNPRRVQGDPRESQKTTPSAQSDHDGERSRFDLGARLWKINSALH